MSKSSQIISGIALTLLLMAVESWMFTFAKLNIDYTVMRIALLPLAAYAVAVYLFNRFIMRRGTSAAVFAFLQVVLMAAAGFLFSKCVSLEPVKLRTIIISGGFYCLIVPVTAFMTFENIKKSALIISFEILTAFIAISIILGNVSELPTLGASLTMDGVAFAAVLLALITERVGRFHGGNSAVQGNRFAGWLLLGIAFAAVVGITAAMVAVAASGVQRVAEICAMALGSIWGGIKSAAHFLYVQLDHFMTWISQFITIAPDESVADAPMGIGNVETSGGATQATIPAWAPYVLAAIGIVILAVILFRLRKHKFTRVQAQTIHYTSARRQSNSGEAMRALWAKLLSNVQYRVDSLRYRRTAPGLLTWCEKHAPKEQQRKTGESGEVFLYRLSQCCEGDCLLELSKALEKTLYAPSVEPVSAELYRSVKKLKFNA